MVPFEGGPSLRADSELTTQSFSAPHGNAARKPQKRGERNFLLSFLLNTKWILPFLNQFWGIRSCIESQLPPFGLPPSHQNSRSSTPIQGNSNSKAAPPALRSALSRQRRCECSLVVFHRFPGCSRQRCGSGLEALQRPFWCYVPGTVGFQKIADPSGADGAGNFVVILEDGLLVLDRGLALKRAEHRRNAAHSAGNPNEAKADRRAASP